MPIDNAFQALTSPGEDDNIARIPSLFQHHCPVTWNETHTLVAGSAEYAVQYGKSLYFLATKLNYEKFIINPLKYVTAKLTTEFTATVHESSDTMQIWDSKFGSICPVSLKSDILRKTSREISALYRGKVFYFYTAEKRDEFIKQPQVYVYQDTPVPKPRIFIAGEVTALSELTVSRVDFHDVPVIKYHEFIRFGNFEKNEDGLCDSKHVLTSLYELHYDGFVLSGFPSTSEELETLSAADSPFILDTLISIDGECDDDLQTLLDNAGIPHSRISADMGTRSVVQKFQSIATSLLKDRNDICKSVIEVSASLAAEMIKCGSASICEFGRFCPVLVSRKSCLLKQCGGSVPALYDDKIYFLKDHECLDELKADTKKYVESAHDVPRYVLAPFVFIVGTSDEVCLEVARQLVISLDMEALDYTTLGDTEALWNFNDLAMQANRGVVVTGFPANKHHVEAALSSKFESSLVIEIGDFMSDGVLLRTFADDFLGSWKQVGHSSDMYKAYLEARKHIVTAFWEREVLQTSRGQSKAAICNLSGMRESLCRENMGASKEYCPVSLSDSKDLRYVDSCNFMVEYKRKFYICIDSKAMVRFIESPETYCNIQLPTELPQLLNHTHLPSAVSFPDSFEYQGYCPVKLKASLKLFHDSILGSHEFLVQYDSRYYTCSSQDALQIFLQRPHEYVGLQDANRLPRRMDAKSDFQLPISGYLNSTLAGLLQHAIQDVGSKKYVYPFQPASVSAAHYLALLLKSNNPNSSMETREMYDERLQKFEETCKKCSNVSVDDGLDNTNLDEIFALKSVAMP